MKNNKKTIPAFALVMAAVYGGPSCAAGEVVEGRQEKDGGR